MRYTIVSYRSNGDDYCRGCHMASSSSDFSLQETEDPEEAASWVADKVMDDRKMADVREVNEWEVYILCNGDSREDEVQEKVRLRAGEIVAERVEAERVKKEAKTRELERKAAEKEEAARVAKLAHERAEYERLKQIWLERFGARRGMEPAESRR